MKKEVYMPITKLIQLEFYPTGDCMRTVIVCLLGADDPTTIPNFMSNGEMDFNHNFEEWLNDNGLEWVELTWQAFCESPSVPLGYCGVSGRSPRGEWDHIVVGESGLTEDGRRQVRFVHDTSPYHDGTFIEGDPTMVGFLLRKL